MIKRILKWVDSPEPQIIVWRWPLPARLFIVYLVAQWAALLLIGSFLETDLADPQGAVILWAGLLAAGFMLPQIIQYVDNARWKHAESTKKTTPEYTVTELLSLKESKSVPVWVIWLAALALAIIIDNIAILAGKPLNSLPLGLDRLTDASADLWILTMLLFVIAKPVVESLIFQGILYPALVNQTQNNRRAVLMTALAFTLFTFLPSVGSDIGWGVLHWGLLYPFTMGLTLSTIRAYSKSTTATIGAQVMFGIFLILKALVVYN